MKTYEMLYVLENALADDAKEALAAKFEEIVTSMGGTVVSTDKWGTKKLAYPINYKNEGYYALMTFEAQPAVVKELDRVAGITDGVIRRMITVKA
ncbi:MAG: 30S ribosomal protein S6 [Clostridia bacterium]|nr:30S ribosomal protein S6 [Clostridia bacterium]